MLLLEIMKETLEDYISRQIILRHGQWVEYRGWVGYIHGVKEVHIVKIVRLYGKYGYKVYCEDYYGHTYELHPSNVYLKELNKVERILYVK